MRTTSVEPDHSYKELLSNGQVFIRSRRLLERRSKKRKATRGSSNDVLCSVVNSKKKEKSKKFGRVLDPDEPFKLFLRDRETTEFLTAKEEKQMFGQIQACLPSPPLPPCLILMQFEVAAKNLVIYTESYETRGGSTQIRSSMRS